MLSRVTPTMLARSSCDKRRPIRLRDGTELLSVSGQETEKALGDPRRERQAGQVVRPGGEAAQT